MRILVCGGRDYSDRERVYADLDRVHASKTISCLISGGAKGADTIAANWARSRSIPLEEHPANWDKYGKSAGFRRNEQMLREGKPDAVIAYPGGSGTASMVKLSKKAGLCVWER